jgi:acyl transferase domain-containing protein
MGGTNAHAVIEEAPRAVPRGHGHGPAALLLSARTAAALDRMTTRLHAYLDEHPEVTVADAAWTLQTGRGQFEHRRAAVVADRAGALAALGSPGRWSDGLARRRSVVFLFPGQGAPGAGAGRELYEAVADFRADVDRCAAIMGQQMDVDLIELMFGAGQPGTEHAQPALFTLEYALARQLERWGVNADAMLGHSVGELAAACLAEVFDLESALGLVATRGRAIAATPPGGMLNSPPDTATRRRWRR